MASYRHARDVVAEHGDPVMAPWLALTTDGMLLAALVVIWVRRHRRDPVGVGPWAAFWAGMAATIAANLAAVQPTPVGIVVALWPPVCLAITLELIALVASPAKHHPGAGTVPAEWSTHVPDHAQLVPGHGPAVTGPDDQAPETRETAAAPGGGEVAGPSPVDRRKQGMKRSLLVDGYGIPLERVLARAHRHDSPLLAPTLDLLDDLGPLPDEITVHLDSGYDSGKTRDTLTDHGLHGEIARRGEKAPSQATHQPAASTDLEFVG